MSVKVNLDEEVFAALVDEARRRSVTTRGLLEEILEAALPALKARSERASEIRALELRLAELRGRALRSPKTGRSPSAHIATLVELYNSGLRPVVIAERLGLTQRQVSRVITEQRKRGLITHPPRRAGRRVDEDITGKEAGA